MGWLSKVFGEPETRQANYTDTVVAGLVASASAAGPSSVSLTAAAEIARSQWGRAFAAARSDVLDPAQLEMIGRALCGVGEIVFLRARGELIPVAAHDVFGIGPRPDDWQYRVTVNAPVGQLTRSVGYGDVAHFRVRATPDAPWQGRSAWAACQTTAALAARLETSLANEQRSGVGAVVAVPDAQKADEDGVTAALMTAKGSILLATARRQWMPGPDEGPVAVSGNRRDSGLHHRQVKLSYAAASWAASSQRRVCPGSGRTGHAILGLARRFPAVLFGTIAPVGRIVALEAQRSLGGSGSLDWSALSASDITGRARAFASLIKSGMDVDEAKRVAGL